MLNNYVITLSSMTERNKHVEKEFLTHQIPFEFFEAVLPGKQLDELMVELWPNLLKALYSPKEKSCFMNHVLLWKKCVDDNLPYIGIFENDIILGRDARLFLADDKWLKQRFSGRYIVRGETYFMRVALGQSQIPSVLSHHVEGDVSKTIDYAFNFLNSTHHGSAGYIISQEAARELLMLIKSLPINDIYPIDHIKYSPYFNGSVRVFQINPAICIQADRLYPETLEGELSSALEKDREEYRKKRLSKGYDIDEPRKVLYPESSEFCIVPFEYAPGVIRNNETIKLSVIVVVYNQGLHLRECLDSILRQTLVDIQIICINDGSVDGSELILDEYVKKDGRVEVIHFIEHKGLLFARKVGMRASKGIFTIFIDPYDYCASNVSFESIYSQMMLEGVDILTFKRDEQGEISKREGRLFSEGINSLNGIYGRLRILRGLVDKEYDWSLKNKIFLTELCRRVVDYIKDEHVFDGGDLFIFFLISYYAKSFRIIHQDLYLYHSYDSEIISLNIHQRDIDTRKEIEWLRAFLTQKSQTNYLRMLDSLEYVLLLKQARNLLFMEGDVQNHGYRLSRNSLDGQSFCSFMEGLAYWKINLPERFNQFINSEAVREKKQIKTLCLYYPSGIEESEIRYHDEVFKNLGYDVVLLQEEKILPSLKNGVLEKFICDNKIDCVVFYDLLAKYTSDIALMVRAMGCYLIIMEYLPRGGKCILDYQLADVVVVHTPERKAFYEAMQISCVEAMSYYSEEEILSMLDKGSSVWESAKLQYDYFKNKVPNMDFPAMPTTFLSNIFKQLENGEFYLQKSRITGATKREFHIASYVEYLEQELGVRWKGYELFQQLRPFSVKKLLVYRLLSKVTWGAMHEKYKERYQTQLRLYGIIKNGCDTP